MYTQLLLSLAVYDTTLSRQGFERSELFINSFELLIMVDGKSRIKKINFRFFRHLISNSTCVYTVALIRGGQESSQSLSNCCLRPEGRFSRFDRGDAREIETLDTSQKNRGFQT